MIISTWTLESAIMGVPLEPATAVSFEFPLENDLEDCPLDGQVEVGSTGGVGVEGGRIGSISTVLPGQPLMNH